MGAAAEVLWQPHPGPQTRALSSGVFELGYGGGAGGGKSAFLTIGPIRWIHHPTFRAVLFRRTFQELEQSLIPESWRVYPYLGGDYNQQKHVWQFYDAKGNPTGSVTLAHLQHDKDVLEWKGAELQYVGFDELPTFSYFQYRYMFSRMRSAVGIPSWVRATMNPEPGWVRDRWAPWVRTSPEYKGVRAADGEVLYYLPDDTDPEGHGRYVPKGTMKGTTKAFGRQFIAARLEDNPSIMLNDPGYVDRLELLDPVQRARLRENDWETEYAAGLLFQRAWFSTVAEAPATARRVRFWDRAATEVKLETRASLQPQAVNDPDWSAGVLHARDGGRHFIEDVVRMRGKPGDVQQTILRTAEADEAKYGRHGFSIVLEQEPGASGEAEIAAYVQLLARWHVVAVRPTGKKVVRAGPFSGQVQARNVALVRGDWNGAYLSELEAFPKGKHDDQVDASSGGYNYLAGAPTTEGASVRGERKATNLGGF